MRGRHATRRSAAAARTSSIALSVQVIRAAHYTVQARSYSFTSTAINSPCQSLRFGASLLANSASSRANSTGEQLVGQRLPEAALVQEGFVTVVEGFSPASRAFHCDPLRDVSLRST